MDTRIERFQWELRKAVQKLQKTYRRNPWVFITESDIQCHLFSEIQRFSSGGRKTIVKGFRDENIRDPAYRLLTKPLHAELSTKGRRATEFVDLCLIDPSKFTFWIKRRGFDRFDKRYPIWDWDWKKQDAIGIEVKFNRWVTKAKAYSRKSKRERITDKWRNYKQSLIRDIKKLKRYKRGWLVLVDHHSLIATYREWRTFVDEIIRKSNYGYAKRTLNAYYLCPKLKRALSFKSPGYYNW